MAGEGEAALELRIVKPLDAEAIDGQQELTAPAVPQPEGEGAPEPGDEVLSVAGVECRQQPGVALLTLDLGGHIREIRQLEIADRPGCVVRLERLRADAAHERHVVTPGTGRLASSRHAAGHRRQHVRAHGPGRVTQHEPADQAHSRLTPSRTWRRSGTSRVSTRWRSRPQAVGA